MKAIEVIQQYINYLSEGDVEHIISLFADKAFVFSPIYGEVTAREFYKRLSLDTRSSELEIIDIYKSSDNVTHALETWAVYFNYKWTLKNGEIIEFDVVDIFYFNKEHLITELKIIYDASKTISQVQQLG